MDAILKDHFAFPTTEDEEEDQKIAEGFVLRNQRMENNICPNGCTTMTFIDPYNRECPKCGFSGFSTKPFDMKTGTA